MKQIEKLLDFIKNPKNYGFTRNNVEVKLISQFFTGNIAGRIQTGYSSKNDYFIHTGRVTSVLDMLHVSYVSGNDAPRGGACGEYVRLTGTVLKDVILYRKGGKK